GFAGHSNAVGLPSQSHAARDCFTRYSGCVPGMCRAVFELRLNCIRAAIHARSNAFKRIRAHSSAPEALLRFVAARF
ncbi:MAG: hypothetical protein V4793_47850, partial [Paraburkholderia tropica]